MQLNPSGMEACVDSLPGRFVEEVRDYVNRPHLRPACSRILTRRLKGDEGRTSHLNKVRQTLNRASSGYSQFDLSFRKV